MPKTIIDAEGNEHSIPTEEEISSLKEKAGQSEELKQQLEGLKDVRTLRKSKESLEKFARENGYELNKDFELIKKDSHPAPANTSGKEGASLDGEKKQEDPADVARRIVQEEKQKEIASAVEQTETEKLNAHAPEDTALRTTIEAKYLELKGDRTLTPKQAESLIDDAARLIGASKTRISEMDKALSGRGGSAPQGGAGSSDDKSSRRRTAIERLRSSGAYNFKGKEDDIINYNR